MRLNHLFFCPTGTLSDRQMMSWFLISYKEAGDTTNAQSSLGNTKIIHILCVSVYYIHFYIHLFMHSCEVDHVCKFLLPPLKLRFYHPKEFEVALPMIPTSATLENC